MKIFFTYTTMFFTQYSILLFQSTLLKKKKKRSKEKIETQILEYIYI